MDLVEALTRHFGGREDEPDSPDDFTGRIVNALMSGGAAGPGGHAATAAEKAGAYRRYAEARERRYGRPPDAEQIRGSLTPAGASATVRRVFGG